ncbi:hypothetical protein COV94_00285, partial [Candidatus Woesearchaeota archaeon CG11_big_fil_rev_8_21_14_0_20_57_5]
MALLIITLPAAFAVSISGLQADVTESTAQVSWTTDIAGDSRVTYAKEGAAQQTAYVPDSTTTHSVLLQGLDPGTTYTYTVRTGAADGVAQQDSTFMTSDATPPAAPVNLSYAAQLESITVSWAANEEEDFSHYIIWLNGQPIESQYAEITISIQGLTPLTSYEVTVSAVDNAGNAINSSITATTAAPDFEMPRISNVSIKNLTDTAATIVWVTNEQTTGTLQIKDGASATTPSGLSHSASLQNLIKNTTYRYTIEACDAQGNCARTDEDFFIAGDDRIPPPIEADVPRYYHREELPVLGSTEPGIMVRAFV